MKNPIVFAATFFATASAFAPFIARAQIGLDFLNLPPGAQIGDVLSRLYVYGVGVVAISAMIMLVIGGMQYMVAGEKDPGPAKERIKNAIWGLILALCSYLILYTINPDLTKKVKLEPLKIDLVAPPTFGKVGENGPCKGAGAPEEICATGGCYTDKTECTPAYGNVSGICLASCIPPTKKVAGERCADSGECGSGLICFDIGPQGNLCNRTLPATGGICLYVNCKRTP